MRRFFIVILLLSFLCKAEVIIMENGSVYEGKIKEETKKMIIIKTEIGEIGIPKERIKEIKYDWMKEGEREYNNGNWEEAVKIFEKYIEKTKKRTKEREKAIFKAGMCYMKLKEKQKAFEKFSLLLKEYPETIYREKAELEIGKIYMDEGEKEKAEEIFEKVRGSWDEKIRGEDEYYLFKLNPPEREEEKEEFYRNYILRYPGSPYISEILYLKAKDIYSKMKDREKYTIKNIPQYREITQILEEAKEKTKNPEILKKIYPLLIICYDHLARYKEKHNTMKEYAEILYPNKKEKQAQYIKQEADKLKDQGEIPEAISLYRFIIESYPDTEITFWVLFQLGKIFEAQADWESALNFYLQIPEKDKKGMLTEKVMPLIGKMYLQINKNKEAIEIFQKFLNKFSESMYKEEVIYKMGVAYYNSGNKKEAKDTFNLYLREYPNGRYKKEAKFFLNFLGNEGGKKWR